MLRKGVRQGVAPPAPLLLRDFLWIFLKKDRKNKRTAASQPRVSSSFGAEYVLGTRFARSSGPSVPQSLRAACWRPTGRPQPERAARVLQVLGRLRRPNYVLYEQLLRNCEQLRSNCSNCCAIAANCCAIRSVLRVKVGLRPTVAAKLAQCCALRRWFVLAQSGALGGQAPSGRAFGPVKKELLELVRASDLDLVGIFSKINEIPKIRARQLCTKLFKKQLQRG